MDENFGEIVFETLLNYNINTITSLNFSDNRPWFRHEYTQEERSGNVDLLENIISNQAGL